MYGYTVPEVRTMGKLENADSTTFRLLRIAAMTAAFVLLTILCRAPVISVYAVLAPALVFGGLALIAYALCRLVRRAAALQRDSDLAI